MKSFVQSNLYRIILLITLLIAYGNIYPQNDTLKIIHTSDTHLVFQLEECDELFYNLKKVFIGNDDSLKNFFKTVPQKMDADAVIITGDLIDYYEAAIDKYDGAMIGNQVEQFNSVYELSPVPTYLTLGNHCLTTYWINKKESTLVQTQAYADKARAEFIRNVSCFENGTYYKKEFQAGKTKYHFFFLDNGNSLPSDWIDKTQLAWLNIELEKIGNEPVVLFQHRYFPIGDVNSDGIYFKKDKPTDWPKVEQCSKGFLKILNEYSNIKAILVGHGHRNSWEGINFPNGHKIYQIETGTVYDSANNWRLIKFTEKSIIVSKVGTSEMEIEIDGKKKKE